MAQKEEGLNGISENGKLKQAANQAADRPTKIDRKKDVRADKKEPGVLTRTGKWLKDMRSELKKVQRPIRRRTVNNIVTVIICYVIADICIWLFGALIGAVIITLLDLLDKG